MQPEIKSEKDLLKGLFTAQYLHRISTCSADRLVSHRNQSNQCDKRNSDYIGEYANVNSVGKSIQPLMEDVVSKWTGNQK